MKKPNVLKIIIFPSLVFIFLIPQLIFAVTLKNPIEAESFEALINSIINIIFMVGVIVAPIMFIVAGFFFLTAAGNPQQLEKAKKTMLWTAVGLFIILFAKGIISVLQSLLGGVSGG
jgi:heme/copper-type cytochrome/quinol oxidase subunit 2